MRLLLCYVVSICEKSFSKSIWMLFTDMFMVWIEKKLKTIPKQKGRGGGLGVLNFPKCVLLALKTTFWRKETKSPKCTEKDRKKERQKTYEFRITKLNQDEQKWTKIRTEFLALKTTFWRKESKCPEKFLKEYLSAVYRHVYGLNCKKK